MPHHEPRTSPLTAEQTSTVRRYSGFRPEVQGLRAVAVFLVVVYHVFMGRVSGGVDIFLFISAFFMTLSFVRKLESGRSLAIGRYWLHTFKRLLPLAVVVILATLVLLAVFFPPSVIADYRAQGLGSAFYVENWLLAAASVDYYAADHSTASPFQHFWSLSVQGQVFLAWPLIFGLAWLIKRRTGRSSVPVLAVCFGLVFVASLTFSVITTHTNQAFAYFDTRTRLWEFALGSLVALAIPYLKPGRPVRLVLGWVGIVSMVSVGLLIDVQGAFPGWIALWPLLSAAAIIVAGQSGSRFGFDRFLSWSPIVKTGDAAYALYLVHWPLLITYLVIRDRPQAGPRSGVVLVLVSLLLALVLTKLVENPMKSWAWPEQTKSRLALVIAACLALVTVPVLTWNAVDEHKAAELEKEAVRNNPGAHSLAAGFRFQGDPDAQPIPTAAQLPEQWVGLPESCAGDYEATDPEVKTFCRQTPAVDDPEKVVVVVGNSHMEQFMGAVIPVAERNDWQLISLLQPGCGFGIEGQSEQCRKGNEAALEYIEDLDPDLVMTTSTRAEKMAPDKEHVVAGLDRLVSRLTDDGVQVVGFRDNPRLDFNPYACVEQKGEDDPSCTVRQDQVLAPQNPAASMERLDGYTNVDLTDLICPEGECRPVIGNVHVWLDDHHLTWDYAETMDQELSRRLQPLIGG